VALGVFAARMDATLFETTVTELVSPPSFSVLGQRPEGSSRSGAFTTDTSACLGRTDSTSLEQSSDEEWMFISSIDNVIRRLQRPSSSPRKQTNRPITNVTDFH
jgi:hypothetical protein